MFSIKCFKTNKIQPLFDFLLGLHLWPGRLFAIPEMFNFSNKSANTIQHNIEYLNIPTTLFFFLFVEIDRKKVSFEDEPLAGQVSNHMVIKSEVGRRMWGKGYFRLWVSESESEVADCNAVGWKWEWGVRSQKVRVGLRVVRWMAESESEAAGSYVRDWKWKWGSRLWGRWLKVKWTETLLRAKSARGWLPLDQRLPQAIWQSWKRFWQFFLFFIIFYSAYLTSYHIWPWATANLG